MIHGTWGWKGNWWYPGKGDFHDYALGLRPNLHALGRPFSWSGAYRKKHREEAAARFSEEWYKGKRIDTVFAHSLGGDIASRAATKHRTKINDLVLLSTPATDYVKKAVEANNVGRVVDVRLGFDIVLALAHCGQRLADHPAVTKIFLEERFWSHSASHNPKVWEAEGIAAQAGLSATSFIDT